MSVFIKPDWPVAGHVRSMITTRYSPDKNKQSPGPYSEFNLADHVNDDVETVNNNRRQLIEYAQLPTMPAWQNQVHGTQVQILGKTDYRQADACYTNQANQVCVIMTADCLPVLLVDKAGTEVAAVHAGWRGLLAGVLEKTLAQFQSNNIMAYLGPAISQQHYQVGQDVYQAFVSADSHAKSGFINDGEAHYKMDIAKLAKLRLEQANVSQIYGGDFCTYAEERFYSYRQACHQGDGSTGRMASLIWLAN